MDVVVSQNSTFIFSCCYLWPLWSGTLSGSDQKPWRLSRLTGSVVDSPPLLKRSRKIRMMKSFTELLIIIVIPVLLRLGSTQEINRKEKRRGIEKRRCVSRVSCDTNRKLCHPELKPCPSGTVNYWFFLFLSNQFFIFYFLYTCSVF